MSSSLAQASLMATLLVAGDVSAARGLERGHDIMRVGVLSPGSYVRDASDLFQERPTVTHLRLETGLWSRRLEALLSSRDHVTLRSSDELRTRLQTQTAVKTSSVVVREAFSLGVERYRGLKVKSARKLFERALKLAESIHWDVVRPTELADITFYRGLCLVEEGDLNKARLAFRETFLLDPGRRFQKGYYPEIVEASLRDAWETLSVEKEKARLLHPIHRLHQLATKARVDALFILHFDRLEGQTRAHVTVFDRQSRGIVASERFPTDELAEHLDRFVSRWHTCALQTRRAAYLAEPLARYTLEMGYNHGLFLHHRRTRALLQSPGVSFGMGYMTSKNVHVFGRLTHLETMPDKNGDLLDPFGLTHVAFGAGLGGDVGRLGVFVEIGLEAAVAFRDITMTDDVDCKHFGLDHARCTRLFTMDAPGFFFGVVFNSGVRFRLKRGWYLQAQSGISAYFLEKNFAADINYPLVVRFGVAHRF